MKRAVFPGSFDPITTGHLSIVKRMLPLFDEIVVAIGNNTSKKYFFDITQRLQWIQKVFEDEPKAKVDTYQGLTIDYCRKISAAYLIRGLRNSSDFEFEKNIAQMNHAMQKNIETVFIVSTPELSAISSTIVRDIIRNGGNVAEFVPPEVKI